MTKKIIFAIFIALLLLTVVILIWINKPQPSKPSTQNAKSRQLEEIDNYADIILASQQEIAGAYLNLNLSSDRKIAVLFDLMAPLGALDPIANPDSVKHVPDVINYMLGVYAKKFGIPEKDVLHVQQSPFRYANKFKEKEYFDVNKSTLNSVAKTFETSDDLEILGYWATSVFRINHLFGDIEKSFTWELLKSNKPFFEYRNFSNEPHIKTKDIVGVAIEKYMPTLGKISDIEIESVYKCEDKIIFILAGTADNALGYIYNASSTNEINCGYLKDRFNLLADKVMDDKWRYWVAN